VLIANAKNTPRLRSIFRRILVFMEMYSRKFDRRLHGKFGNLLKTEDYPDVTDWGTVVGFADMRNSDEIEVLRERKFVSASSRNQQAGSLRSQSGKLAKGFGVTAAAAA
jgi:hypothetical protein